MHSSETSPGNRHSNGLHGGLHPNLSTSSYASTSQPQLQAAPMNNNSDVFAASRGTDPLSSSHSQILQSRNSTHTPSQRGSRRRMREAVSFAEMPPKYSFQFPNTSTTHELSYGSPKQLHGPGFSDANPLRLHDTHTGHDHSTTGSGFPHGSASVTFANEAAMRHSMQPMMPSLIDSGGQSITHTSRGLDASAASSSTDAPSSASDLRTTTFSIPLNLAVLLNILITVGLVAMISTVPLSSVSNRSMERVTTTLSSYLANTLVQAMYANILFVPLVVKAYASGWLVSNTQASWTWTSADMLEAMRQMCVFNQWSSNTPLLYISMSSPITGYGAYCSAQYSSNFLVGQYTAGNESDYRYLIDPFTGEYIQPLEPFLPVERMSAYDYTVTFGGDGNVWHNVVEPWFHSQNVNGPCSNCNSWWVWTEGQVSALTYNIPFVDYAGNPGVISAGLQPFTLTAVFPSGQSVMEAIGSAAVVDPKTGMVLVNSWGENAPTMLDNWNASAVGGFEIPTGLYMGDIHDALMSDTFSKLGGKAGLQAVALDVMQWSVHFQSAGSPAYAVVSRIALGDDVPINYLVIYAIRRDQYANDVTTVEHAVIACVTIIIFVIAAVDMILIYLFLHPLRGVAKGLRDTAQLRDGSGHIEGRFSIIREVAQMQYHFTVMNGQLLRMKAFLPQGVLGGGEIWSGSENEDGDLDPNMMGGQDELDYLHLNERALLDEENKLKRRYCSVLLICLHMKESEHAIVSQLCAQFMEGVIPHVLRHGGVIENQRPDVIFASFGSQNKLAIHQMRAAKCALEIFTQAHIQGKIASRLACFLDAGEYFIGTCGAMQRNARVTFGLRLPSHPEILKLSKVLRAQILSSQRFANSIDEDVLSMPVDCIVGTLTKRVVVIYEVRGSVKSLPETVNADEIRQMLKAARLAFSKMLTGDYTGALAFVEPYERRDPQVARIIRTCRTQIKKGCTEPYHRYIGRIRFSEDNVNYDSSAQAAALANNMDMGVSVLYKSMRLNPTNDTDPLSRFPQRQASSVKPHDPPPSDSAIGESKDDDEENTALFEMFIEDDDSDNDPGFSTSSLHGGGGSATQVAASVAVGELPIVFEDIEGTTWTRSVDRLGTGAFSDVYRGLSTSGNLVALKCIRLRAKNIEYNDIISEVRLFSSLHHENIVQYISVYVSTAHLIEIMEFVPGGSLDSLLTSFGKFSDAIVRRFLRDILRGLRYLHSKSIAHCDIKPHNVLLAMDGQCKISDFGSALSRATADEQKNDDELDLRGTPGYVAPEVARGDVPTMKSDIFSIGVTVLELLTGHLPWKYTTDEPTPPPNAVTSPTQFAPVSAAVTHEGRRESMPTGVSPLMGDLLDLHNGSFGGGDATGEKSPAKANGAGAGGVPNFSEMPQRRPIENVLRDATQLIRCIGNGSVFPYIPEDLEATVTDFLKKCLNPNPEVRATTEELLLHPWLA